MEEIIQGKVAELIIEAEITGTLRAVLRVLDELEKRIPYIKEQNNIDIPPEILTQLGQAKEIIWNVHLAIRDDLSKKFNALDPS